MAEVDQGSFGGPVCRSGHSFWQKPIIVERSAKRPQGIDPAMGAVAHCPGRNSVMIMAHKMTFIAMFKRGALEKRSERRRLADVVEHEYGVRIDWGTRVCDIERATPSMAYDSPGRH